MEWLIPAIKLNKLLRSGQFIKIEKDEIIRSSEKNDRFYLLTKGYVKRYMITNDGSIDIQSFYGPGYFLPLITVFKGFFEQEIYSGPETYYYEAMTYSELYFTDISTVVAQAETDPQIYRELLMISGRRLGANIQQIENRSLRTFYNRVAHQIAFLSEVFSNRSGDMAKLKIPLTQQDLADSLSTTRETVSLCMSNLKKNNLIITGKYITVPSIKKLKKEAFK